MKQDLIKQDLSAAPPPATQTNNIRTIREIAIEEVANEVKVPPLVFMRDYLAYPEYAHMVRERELEMAYGAEFARIEIDEPTKTGIHWASIAFFALIVFIVLTVAAAILIAL